MTKNSPTFDIEKQRGRFYVNAEMLRERAACSGGLARYLEVFGEKRHKFNKTFIRKAVNESLNLEWLAYKADTKYGTDAEDRADRKFSQFYAETDWGEYPNKKQQTVWWIEAFTEAGYI